MKHNHIHIPSTISNNNHNNYNNIIDKFDNITSRTINSSFFNQSENLKDMSLNIKSECKVIKQKLIRLQKLSSYSKYNDIDYNTSIYNTNSYKNKPPRRRCECGKGCKDLNFTYATPYRRNESNESEENHESNQQKLGYQLSTSPFKNQLYSKNQHSINTEHSCLSNGIKNLRYIEYLHKERPENKQCKCNFKYDFDEDAYMNKTFSYDYTKKNIDLSNNKTIDEIGERERQIHEKYIQNKQHNHNKSYNKNENITQILDYDLRLNKNNNEKAYTITNQIKNKSYSNKENKNKSGILKKASPYFYYNYNITSPELYKESKESKENKDILDERPENKIVDIVFNHDNNSQKKTEMSNEKKIKEIEEKLMKIQEGKRNNNDYLSNTKLNTKSEDNIEQLTNDSVKSVKENKLEGFIYKNHNNPPVTEIEMKKEEVETEAEAVNQIEEDKLNHDDEQVYDIDELLYGQENENFPNAANNFFNEKEKEEKDISKEANENKENNQATEMKIVEEKRECLNEIVQKIETPKRNLLLKSNINETIIEATEERNTIEFTYVNNTSSGRTLKKVTLNEEINEMVTYYDTSKVTVYDVFDVNNQKKQRGLEKSVVNEVCLNRNLLKKKKMFLLKPKPILKKKELLISNSSSQSNFHSLSMINTNINIDSNSHYYSQNHNKPNKDYKKKVTSQQVGLKSEKSEEETKKNKKIAKDLFLNKQIESIKKIKDLKTSMINKNEEKNNEELKKRLNSKDKTRNNAILFDGLKTDFVKSSFCSKK